MADFIISFASLKASFKNEAKFTERSFLVDEHVNSKAFAHLVYACLVTNLFDSIELSLTYSSTEKYANNFAQ